MFHGFCCRRAVQVLSLMIPALLGAQGVPVDTLALPGLTAAVEVRRDRDADDPLQLAGHFQQFEPVVLALHPQPLFGWHPRHR